MNTSQVSLQVSVLAEHLATHWTGGPSLVGVQVPLEGDFLPKLPRADFAHKRVLGIARAAFTFIAIYFTQYKISLVTVMRNLIGALAQLIHIDVLYVCEQLSLTSKSHSQLGWKFIIEIKVFLPIFKRLQKVWQYIWMFL